MSLNRILIASPTYNEKDNVGRIYEQLKEVDVDFDILFVDDNSPDGTGKVLDQIALKDEKFKVMHRTGKQGIGSAHKVAIQYAYDNKYDTLITMDCDSAHSPSEIPNFLKQAENNDIVIGTRYLIENSMEGWSPLRRFLSGTAHFMTESLLKMPYDSTNAYRLYRLDHIPRGLFSLIRSDSYSFFFESLYIMHTNRTPITEIPIHLEARSNGSSKMTIHDAFKSVKMLFSIFLRKNFKRSTFRLPINKKKSLEAN
jgi:dolichol-phosphate mannosyltransferase